MSGMSSHRLLVLHGLRVKGLAEADVLATATGLEEGEVERELRGLLAEGLVRRRDGVVSGWALVPAGRDEHDRLVEAELVSLAVRGDVESAYRGFRQLNTGLLSLCTDWQRRDSEDRSALVARLTEIHDALEPVLADLCTALPRFDPYRRRLAHAVDRVRSGDDDWVTRPTIDSYHTVWFELHEDLLSTLGLRRGAEGVLGQ